MLQGAVPAWIRHHKAAHGVRGGKCCFVLQTRGAELFNLYGLDSGSVHSSWQMLSCRLKCTEQQSSTSAWRTCSAPHCLLITASAGIRLYLLETRDHIISGDICQCGDVVSACGKGAWKFRAHTGLLESPLCLDCARSASPEQIY